MATTPPAKAAGAAGGRSYFERERDRLVTEISDGIEVIMSNSNTLNRKLEESISVGKEFEPIAELWGQLSNVMTRAGIPDLAAEAQAAAAGDAAGAGASQGPAQADAGSADDGGVEEGRRSRQAGHDDEGGANSLKRSLGASSSSAAGTADLLGTDDLPPGVIPGGGVVYGRDT